MLKVWLIFKKHVVAWDAFPEPMVENQFYGFAAANSSAQAGGQVMCTTTCGG
jgi:hypothetical protein